MLRSFSSEFPHDNPELSDGVVWICTGPCARALPLRHPEAVAPGTLVLGPDVEPVVSRETIDSREPELASASAPTETEVEAPTEMKLEEPTAMEVEEPTAMEVEEPTAEAAPDDASTPSDFQRLLEVMQRMLLDAGATRAAAELPLLLSRGRLQPQLLGRETVTALRARGYLGETDAPTPAFRQAADGWRAVLSGESSDLERCGESTLDAWAASLLSALLGGDPGTEARLQKQLRRCGVAAFGMLDAA